MDRLLVDLDTDRRECVACGFADERPDGASTAAEVPTRVTRASARRAETPAEAVTLLDSGRDRSDD
jgi:Zn ribbon nucleic-acid-binding protein